MKLILTFSLLVFSISSFAQSSHGGTGGNGVSRELEYLNPDFIYTEYSCPMFRHEDPEIQHNVCRSLKSHLEKYSEDQVVFFVKCCEPHEIGAE